MVVRPVAALAILLLSAAAGARPVPPEQLLRHIEILASDEYGGREPGTEGERKTIAYIRGQFERLGLEPAGEGGGWFQPVALVTREPTRRRARWTGPRGSVTLGEDSLILVGDRAEEKLTGLRVVFAGHGAVLPGHGIDQLAGAPIKGAAVLILHDPPDVAGFPSFEERTAAVAARGASAVIGIVGAETPWRAVRQIYGGKATRLESDPVAPMQGLVSQAAAERIAAAGGADLGRLLNSAPGPAFRAAALDLKADLEVRGEVRRIVSNNVIGRLKGKGASGEAVLFLGHWDHFGTCRPEGYVDRICNGAVDNASGIAAMIEIARGLARGARPERDILFLATTAEEEGLLGAKYFAAHPPVPLGAIVAAFNLDTVAIGGSGRKVAIMGRGFRDLDALVAETAHEEGREMDEDQEADAYLERQDGWALRRRGVPAVMVGGAFSDMRALGHFLTGRYHQPNDDLKQPIELGGAAEDAELLIALGRKLADPARYRAPAPLARP